MRLVESTAGALDNLLGLRSAEQVRVRARAWALVRARSSVTQPQTNPNPSPNPSPKCSPSRDQVIADAQPRLVPPAYRAGTQLAPRAGEEPRALQAWVHCWAQMGPGMAELHGYPLWEARLLPG